MNKSISPLTFGLICLSILEVSCKGKNEDKKDGTTNPSTSTTNTAESHPKPTNPANGPKTYQLSLSPDSLYLGKNKEAFIKMLGAEAVELQDAEGKSTGLNAKFKLRVANKSTLDQKVYFSLVASEARLALDNCTSISYKDGESASPEPECSKETAWEFELPAGTKPTKLNLFYDGTRVSVLVGIK